MRRLRMTAVIAWLTVAGSAFAQQTEPPAFERKEDVVYGRKFGTALTLDVFTPQQNKNGAAVIAVVSGGWRSAHESINPAAYAAFLRRGYTVFAVVHGSQPRFTIPEIVADLHRAVRFVRHNAAAYGIDPNRMGITGASAGGHLSLMQGMAGDTGNPQAKDPIDRVSSRVQAVACFFPPTDFLNWGAAGNSLVTFATTSSAFAPYRAAFEFSEFDPATRVFVPIKDEKRLGEIARAISPILHVSPDDPPTLIIHGDADMLVPLQQSRGMVDRLQATGIPTELIVKPGAGHGWPTMGQDMTTLADWFDRHLKKP